MLGHFAVQLAPSGSDVAAWFPAAGVGVAVVTREHRNRWSYLTVLVLVSALANVSAGRPILVAAGFGLSNGLEALVAGSWMNRRCEGGPSLRRAQDVGRFAVGTLLGALSVGIGAAITVAAFTSGDPIAVLIAVVPSHATAVCLVAPFALAVAPATPRRSVEYVLAWSIVVGATMVVFSTSSYQRIAFVLIPILMWSVARLGLRAVTAQLIVVGVLATSLAAKVPGAMGGDGTIRSGTLVQLFVVTCSLLLITFGVVLADRERAVQKARASEATYRAGFVETVVGMMLVRIDGRSLPVVEANGAASALLDVHIGDVLGDWLITEDGRTITEVVSALKPGTGVRIAMFVAGQHGDRWFGVSATRLSGADDQQVVSLQVVDTTAQRQTESALERMALVDSLTGLPNLAAMQQQLAVELEVAKDSGNALALIALDIDEFKSVNEVFGHAVGDAVLAEVGERLSRVRRPGDVVARLGADQFLVLCPGAGSPAAAVVLAERVWAASDLPISIEGLQYEVTFSVGVALSEPEHDPGVLLSEADMAVSAAKAAGKGRVILFSDTLREVAAHRLLTVTEVRRAINHDEFEMFMQPVVDIETGRIIAAEALIRWRLPDGSLRAPAEWLGVAEQSGLMSEIGQWVLDDSVRQAAQWVAMVGEDAAPAVHVNVSARQFERRGFADIVVDTLRRHRLPPELLVLELTETFLAQAGGPLAIEFETLASHGVRLAADDFGTGYSPLTRVLELPIHMIKIDRSFIMDVTSGRRSRAIVAALVTMARNCDLEIVAEGIEEEPQRALLAEMGCGAAQGFLWSPAIEERAFISRLIDARAYAGAN